MEKERTYICIDLKSFYASVECASLGLDPLNTNLVVADEERTDKTICLAVSPSLKKLGVPSRPRLFEVRQKMNEINYKRKKDIHFEDFIGESFFENELNVNPFLEASLLIKKPRMATYIEISSKIYSIYLRYISPSDIHVYSIDEVFIDATKYLSSYGVDKIGLARLLINEVLKETKITATAGIAENMYLAKVAMDIVAKHMAPDSNGVRIATINELEYRKLLWDHTPLTDFWRIGKGIEQRLNKLGLFTMGDIALCSLGKNTDYYNEDLLYKEFGVNAELIIDHAWGYEPCRMEDVKSYVPTSSSLSSGQVLTSAYPYKEALLVVKEMADQLSLDLVEKGLKATSLSIDINFDSSSATTDYKGITKKDYYGRMVPKHANGRISFNEPISATSILVKAAEEIFIDKVNPSLLVRAIYIGASIVPDTFKIKKDYVQMNLFSTNEDTSNNEEYLKKEENVQKAILKIKHKYGKNAVLKAMNLEKGSTMKERNNQIGGHHK